ncbi:MAG: 2-deoxy-D-gluconate 3-dehydrogenase [Phycisphaeraceae bacterium]|nr:2-deoxy-D-gluconate 3-dehydrogenase [Phycisphaeraceae bacterium]
MAVMSALTARRKGYFAPLFLPPAGRPSIGTEHGGLSDVLRRADRSDNLRSAMAVRTTMFDLTNRVALVTGGRSGIGRAIAAALAAHGARVLIGARSADEVEQASRELNQEAEGDDVNLKVAGIGLDVTRDASVERAVRKAIDVFGSLDILVNSAGIMLRTPTFDLTPEQFNELHDVHVTGTLRCAQAAGHLFREQHSGTIINIASLSAFVDLVEVTAYAAAKNAVLGLTRSLANEWAKHGIRTNAIAPGFIPTDLNRRLIENTDRGRRIIEGTPMGRFGTGEEIAGAAVYLASPSASFVNGHTLVVDGGFVACGVGDSVEGAG